METFPIQAVYIYWFIFFSKEHSFSIEKVPVSCDYPMLIINVFNFLWRNLESPWFIVDLSEESKTNLGNSSIKKLTHFAVTRHESFWANPLLIAVSPSPKAYLTQITHTMEIVVILMPILVWYNEDDNKWSHVYQMSIPAAYCSKNTGFFVLQTN